MAEDKVTSISRLLQMLSRIPGLGFLSSFDDQMRETRDSYDDIGDQMDDAQRTAREVRDAAGNVVRNDD